MVKKRTLDLDKILDAAVELINEKGLEDTTLPSLAKKLDIRSQSLYHYVRGRKEMLSLVAAREIKRLRQQLTGELVGMSGEEALLKFADLTRDFLLADNALSAILFHLNEYSTSDEISQGIQSILDLAEKLNLRQGQAISIHVVIGAVLGYVFLDRSAFFTDQDAQKARHDYHQMILRLVRPDLSEA
ncbi:TetR/AcrR family transcriptional regulator [Lactobacillus corticis]|uniref:TetR family transcriptional regulator n=1 Tax=Lactobacillus corticis TaxID=2201249 RepID=A0A916QK72_9LACO|nr:TetR/AcrR family transcriptional regulator [Lactobacillus corticis]GFZ26766.1 TetR family transcriptional regulator [Lactobacillus corticis]